MEAGFPGLVEPAVQFICTCATEHAPATVDDGTDASAIVFQAAEDILALSSKQPLPKVCHRSACN